MSRAFSDSVHAPSVLQPMLGLLASLAGFAHLPREDLDFLAKRLRRRFYTRGQSVGQRGSLCLLQSGRVVLAGSEICTGGAFFGTAEADEDCFCVELPRDGVSALRRRSSAFRELVERLPAGK